MASSPARTGRPAARDRICSDRVWGFRNGSRHAADRLGNVAGVGQGQENLPVDLRRGERGGRQQPARHVVHHRDDRQDGQAVPAQDQAALDVHGVGLGHDRQLHPLQGAGVLEQEPEAPERTGQDQRRAAQVAHRHRMVRAEPRRRQPDHPEFLLQQRLHLDGGRRLVVGQQRGVHFAGLHPALHEVGVAAGGEAELDAGKAGGHGGHQGVGQLVDQAGHQADGDHAGDLAGHGGDLGAGPVQVVQGAPGVLHQDPPGFGQLHPVAAAGEQGGADVLLQQAQLPRHRRLHDVQEFGRTGHAAGVGDGQQGAKLFEIHGQASGLF